MRIDKQALDEAAGAGVISASQARALWDFLAARGADQPGFRAAHILYSLGGGVAIGALSLFITLAWDSWSGLPMLALALLSAVIGLALAQRFIQHKLMLPAGIMVTFAVSTVPLAVYSLQHMLGMWQGELRVEQFHEYIDWRWFYMELATLAAAAAALWRYRMPFTVFVLAVIFWYMSMDLVPLFFSQEDQSWELRELVSLYMGIGVTLLAFWVDLRTARRPDFGFWLYLVGVLMFWGGLSLQHSDSELNKFLYLLINLAMLAVGALLMRRVFAVFAAFGIMGYLFHLSSVFEGSLLFPVALAAAGIGIIFLGIKWQRNERHIHDLLLAAMPPPLRRLLQNVHG